MRFFRATAWRARAKGPGQAPGRPKDVRLPSFMNCYETRLR